MGECDEGMRNGRSGMEKGMRSGSGQGEDEELEVKVDKF